MFCLKCGNELKNGEEFCPKCGAKFGTTGNSINLNLSTNDIKNKIVKMKGKLISGVDDFEKNKMLVLGNITLLILSLIFSFTKVFTVDGILGISQGMSMYQDMIGVKFFFIVGYLLSVLSLASPWLDKKAWSPVFFLPTKIVTILSSIWFLLVLSVGTDEAGSMAEFNLSATGWLFIISTIGAFVLAYKNTFDLKKLIKSSKITVQNNSQTEEEQITN